MLVVLLSSFCLLAPTTLRLRKRGFVPLWLRHDLRGLGLLYEFAICCLLSCCCRRPLFYCFLHSYYFVGWLLLLHKKLLQYLRIHILCTRWQCVLHHIIVEPFTFGFFVWSWLLQWLGLFGFFWFFLFVLSRLVIFKLSGLVLLHTFLLLQNLYLVSQQVKVFLLYDLA